MNGGAVPGVSRSRRLTPAECAILVGNIPDVASHAIAEAAYDAHASVCVWTADECETCRLRVHWRASVRRRMEC